MATELNIFEIASRKKLRFPSGKGELTTEQLWDLPLQSAGGTDLDSIAKSINTQLKSVSEESFVQTAATNPAKAGLELKLEIVKHVIAIELKENADRVRRAEKDSERKKLVELYGRKKYAQLEELPPEEILKRLEALDD